MPLAERALHPGKKKERKRQLKIVFLFRHYCRSLVWAGWWAKLKAQVSEQRSEEALSLGLAAFQGGEEPRQVRVVRVRGP